MEKYVLEKTSNNIGEMARKRRRSEDDVQTSNSANQDIAFLPLSFQPGVWDVICQRGRENYDHVGNKRFRAVIQRYLEEYRKATTKLDKSKVVSEIVNLVRSNSHGGGFVKKDLLSSRWFEVGDKLARDKVGQALRDGISRGGNNLSASDIAGTVDPVGNAGARDSLWSLIHQKSHMPSRSTSAPDGQQLQAMAAAVHSFAKSPPPGVSLDSAMPHPEIQQTQLADFDFFPSEKIMARFGERQDHTGLDEQAESKPTGGENSFFQNRIELQDRAEKPSYARSNSNPDTWQRISSTQSGRDTPANIHFASLSAGPLANLSSTSTLRAVPSNFEMTWTEADLTPNPVRYPIDRSRQQKGGEES